MNVELHVLEKGNCMIRGNCSRCDFAVSRKGSVNSDGSVQRFNMHAQAHSALIQHAITCGGAPGPSSAWTFIRHVDKEPRPPPDKCIEFLYQATPRGAPGPGCVVEKQKVSSEESPCDKKQRGKPDAKAKRSQADRKERSSKELPGSAPVALTDFNMKIEMHVLQHEHGNCMIRGHCLKCDDFSVSRKGAVYSDGSVQRFNMHAIAHSALIQHAITCGGAPGPSSAWTFIRHVDKEPRPPPDKCIEFLYQATPRGVQGSGSVLEKRKVSSKEPPCDKKQRSKPDAKAKSGAADRKERSSKELPGSAPVALTDFNMKIEMHVLEHGNCMIRGHCLKCDDFSVSRKGAVYSDGSVQRFNMHVIAHNELINHAIKCSGAPGPSTAWTFVRHVDDKPRPPPNKRIEFLYMDAPARATGSLSTKRKAPFGEASCDKKQRLCAKAKSSQGDPSLRISDGADHGEASTQGVFGPSSRIRLHQRRNKCPKELLPKVCEILPPLADVSMESPKVNSEIIGEASARGFAGATAPACLGVVPKDLLEMPWSCLLVVGASGSGKTSLLRSLSARFDSRTHDEPDSTCKQSLYPSAQWEPGRAVIDHFENVKEGESWLCAVGLSSVPSWCKPFEALSLGERYRANVARAMSAAIASGAKQPLIFDEWTSELDRGVARSVCVALRRRLLARHAAGEVVPVLVLATCHEDVEDYVAPDALVKCVAGQAPQLVYMKPKVGFKANSRMLRANVLGIMDPYPALGTLHGRWLTPAGNEMVIAKHSNMRLFLRLMCKDAILQVGSEPRQLASAVCVDSASGLDVKAETEAKTEKWWCATIPALNLDIRVRLSEDKRLEVQTRSVAEERIELAAVLERIKKTRAKCANPLLDESFQQSRSKTVYISNLLVRKNQLSKLLDRDFTGPEENMLKSMPQERNVLQKKIAENMLKEVDKRETTIEKKWQDHVSQASSVWDEPSFAIRMPWLRKKALDSFTPSASETDEAAADDAIEEYSNDVVDCLQKFGWYVPREARCASPYPGLQPSFVKSFATAFRLNPKHEERTSHAVHLASYVGEKGGEISSAVAHAASYLDAGFDGLCVHEVPRVESTDVAKEFAIGVCVGPSGSGKSSWAREYWGSPLRVQWQEDKPALAHFTTCLEEASSALFAAALDLDTALRPVGLLSSGERERLTLAWSLSQLAAGRLQKLVLDEFTSLVDRGIARRMARGTMEFLRARPHLRNVVLLTCHADILGRGLLEPDWIFEVATRRLLRFVASAQPAIIAAAAAASGSPLRRGSPPRKGDDGAAASPLRAAPPAPMSTPRRRAREKQAEKIELVVRRAFACEWRHFREHHYKDHRLSPSSCFVGELEGRAVAFTAVMATGCTINSMFGSRGSPEKLSEMIDYPLSWGDRNLLREHRTVVLPDAQGFGLGSIMADAVAHICCEMGYAFMSTTAHPTYGGYRDRSVLWSALPTNLRERGGNKKRTFSHVWLGCMRRGDKTDEASSKVLHDRVRVQGHLSLAV
eukprot:TRINITY_DN10510_c0_g2_i2.p1 TRINITY_DN10510_c0_g2~~TRINITY_DN10510_c0_g2_i2.p1  ORF type:complete len:1544 (-),score=209.37 TRINITY_DN10510_c0_g2_i2:1321-5829(-)